jgi:uncharacterized protein (TIGR02444 family)
MPEAGDTAGEFWAFSLDFYGRPGVAESCLALQDGEGKDVNIVLWCLWVGWSRRGRLSAEHVAHAKAAVAPWRRDVVVPLRSVRRALKGSAVPGAAALRNDIKAAELESERLQHAILASLAPRQKPSPACGRGQGEGLQQSAYPRPDPLPQAGEGERRADAAANLRLYLAADLPEAATLIAVL